MRAFVISLILATTVAAETPERLTHYQGPYHDFFEWYAAAAPTLPTNASEFIVVIGWVKKPGAIKPRDGLTLTQAIAECGGLKDFALKTKVGVWDNHRGQFILANFFEIEHNERPDLPLVKGDMVIVDKYWMTGL